jgi:hypothetical protein
MLKEKLSIILYHGWMHLDDVVIPLLKEKNCMLGGALVDHLHKFCGIRLFNDATYL